MGRVSRPGGIGSLGITERSMRILLSILVALLLTSCATKKTASERWPSLLVGTFCVQTGDRRTELISTADGKFSSRTTIAGQEAWTTAGKWWLADGKLNGIFRQASIPDFPIGEVDSSDLVEVTPDHYTIRNRNGVIKKYQRLR